jgi:hypothetical protein
LIPLLFKKDKLDVQPSTPSVFSIPPYYCLLSFCCSLSIFLSFCSFLFFTILGVVWMCFYYWLSLDHFQIKTLHWFKFGLIYLNLGMFSKLIFHFGTFQELGLATIMMI